MRNLKDAKNVYDHIVVPEELDQKLRNALADAPAAAHHPVKILKFAKGAAAVAAALFLCFTVGLNSSQSFAMEMSKLPVLGSVAKVLTVRSYEEKKDVITTKVEVPKIEVADTTEEVKNAITDVNAQINALVEEFTAQKHKEAEEYKEAFLSTGGTEEEWAERSIDINVNYEVKFQDDSKLSLLVDSWMSSVSFQEERHIYNIDLVTGNTLTLRDLLGEDAYEYAEAKVKEQMEARVAEDPDGLVYWGINDTVEEGIEGFRFPGVDENTPFYLNEAGNVVISYDKYEAAPGYMGIQDFEIPAR